MIWERKEYTIAELCEMTKFTKKFAWLPISLACEGQRVWLQDYYIRWYYSGCNAYWKKGAKDTFEGWQEWGEEGFMEQYNNGGIHRFPMLVDWFKSIKLAIKTFKLKG